ncbi:MAG: hypothetical protein EAX95_03490 [Candidatus Thorarchaeota archaeon]|nr:hypothetical protein [Candidatus Thorarchaeota archaeon]
MSRLAAASVALMLILFAPLFASPLERVQGRNNEVLPAVWPGGLIIDHTCIDLNSIPDQWIDAAKANVKVHYAHTSHGEQITEGLDRLEAADAKYGQAQEYLSLPSELGALCIFDGNGEDTYITPDLYWETPSGLASTQATIDANPEFTVSLWSWCTQLNYYDSEQVQDYLDAISGLEAANPDITFVYMTCNAQATGADGYNRYQNNQLIRGYCLDNDKVLFDFADLDSWSNGGHSTYDYVDGSVTYHVPVEHPDFNGDEAGHTTFTSCEQKGRAFWWMAAMVAGWNAPTTTTTITSTGMTSTTTSTTTTENPDMNLILFSIGGIVALVVVAGILSRWRK